MCAHKHKTGNLMKTVVRYLGVPSVILAWTLILKAEDLQNAEYVSIASATSGPDQWAQAASARSDNCAVPEARYQPTAVWTGSEIIVWGGYAPDLRYFNTGGRFNPALNIWTTGPLANAPIGRTQHTAVWTGTEMLIWGGAITDGVTRTGGRYDPVANVWRMM